MRLLQNISKQLKINQKPMKTGQYYFEKLSAKEQKEYVQNYKIQNGGEPTLLLKNADDKYTDLFYHIMWGRTGQGFDYWKEIANRKVA